MNNFNTLTATFRTEWKAIASDKNTRTQLTAEDHLFFHLMHSIDEDFTLDFDKFKHRANKAFKPKFGRDHSALQNAWASIQYYAKQLPKYSKEQYLKMYGSSLIGKYMAEFQSNCAQLISISKLES